MKYEAYTDLNITDDYSIFDFISHGKNGSILKRIAFTTTELDNVYNLAFGDIDEEGQIDDYSISDNGDRMAIGINQEELFVKFDIYVDSDEQLVPFAKNLEINRFLIK